MSKIVQLNTSAPDFVLSDFKGNPFHLSEFCGKKNVVLIFNRGFTWPFCQRHMAQLRQDFNKFVEQDTIIVVVGPENAQIFKTYWGKERLPFIGLPDPEHVILKQYGQEVKLFKLGRMPAQVIIDKLGIVRYVHYGHQMSDIPKNDDLLEVLKKINQINIEELEIGK